MDDNNFFINFALLSYLKRYRNGSNSMLELPKLKEMFKAWNLLLKLFQLESFSDEVYNQELVDLPGGGINLGEHESQLRSPFCLHVGGLSNTSLPIWSARGYPPPPLSTKFLPSNMLQRDRKGLIGDQNGLKLAHRGLKLCVLTRIIWSFVKNKLHQILLCRFNQQRGTPLPPLWTEFLANRDLRI